MLARFVLCLLLWAAGVPALAQASMSADEAYVRAVAYFEVRFGKLQTDLATEKAVRASETQALRQQLEVARRELAGLKTQAQGGGAAAQTAQTALAAFARGDGARGLDALESKAKAGATQAATAPPGPASAADWLRVADLAYAIDANRAIAAYQEALKRDPGSIYAATQIARLQVRLGNYREAERLYQGALARVKGDDRLESSIYSNLGQIASKRADYTLARRHYELSLEKARRSGSKTSEAVALGNLGNVSVDLKDYAAAERYINQSMAMGVLSQEDRASNFNNLGSLATERGDLKAAESYYRQALDLKGNAPSEGRVSTLNNLAGALKKRGDKAGATALFQQALSIARQIGYRRGAAHALYNLAMDAYYAQDLQGAISYGQQAADVLQGAEERRLLASIWATMGASYFMRREYGSAEYYLEKGRALAAEAGDASVRAIATVNLGAVASARGDTPGACRRYRETLSVLDAAKLQSDPVGATARTRIAAAACP